MRRTCLMAGLIVLAALPVNVHAQPASPETSVANGRTFAVEFCAPCHVVTANQRTPTIYRGSTPSFAQIANRTTTTAASLRNFVRTTHPTVTRPLDMPELEVTDYQLDEIIRYILSLRTRR